MSEPRVLTRPFSTSPLALAAASGTAPSEWYVARPQTAAAWRAHAERVRDDLARTDWHGALASAFAATGPAAARLQRVASGRGIVITTGQQPGLFGGPVYTWSKALSAIALADAVERATGIPTAPVFWAATYDADFAEASVSYVAVAAAVERLQMPEPEQSGRGMRDTPLGNVSALVEALERAAGSAADPAVLDLVRSAYGPKETVGSAFVALVRAILEPFGMAVLDAGHPACRAAQHAVLVRALRDADEVDAALRTREAELRAWGDAPKVAHVTGLSLVFESSNDSPDGAGARRRIPITAAARFADGESRGDLEPNVLLRPVAERAMLPTAAYVAGPGEIAYFAQASAAAAALGAAMPLVLPRWSGMIVEPHVQRILDRYALAVDDLRDPHAALGRLARARMPAAVRDALAAYRGALEDAAAELDRAVAAEQPPLLPSAVLEGARRAIAHRLDRLERRVLAAAKRRETELARDLATARASLFPLDSPQERVLNLFPMLARHGAPLLEAMLERARAHAAAVVDAPADRALAVHDHAGDRR